MLLKSLPHLYEGLHNSDVRGDGNVAFQYSKKHRNTLLCEGKRWR